MFTDFVNECAAGRSGSKISAMMAEDVKVGGGDAKAEAALAS